MSPGPRKRSINNRELMSMHEAAAQLGVSPRSLRRAILAGELPAYMPGTRTKYVRWVEVMAWLQRRRIPSQGDDKL